ncbi:hypothetical protein CISG_05660 [Coccidioides immitis RMSCC 3703]|uniref:Uncharacterized protein n=2 Tax=Coccidioides immitis TaxID=5501 RepID=A0A0J8QWI2_COCIT|nr:hypothetical protein CIRG_00502 [Coccidioides immitis RMSCC 2394]KMU76826.1 hypothetical protein CISG_05660 [Coccidioides immitis RMSCC 3703]
MHHNGDINLKKFWRDKVGGGGFLDVAQAIGATIRGALVRGLPRDTGSMRCRAETRGKAARQPEREENGDGGYRRGRGGRRRRAGVRRGGGSFEWNSRRRIDRESYSGDRLADVIIIAKTSHLSLCNNVLAASRRRHSTPGLEGAIHMKNTPHTASSSKGQVPRLVSRVPSQFGALATTEREWALHIP